MDLLQQGGALVVVFGMLGAALWFLKSRKIAGTRIRGERRMQVIERVSLTPNHTLCLVRVGERLVMIGTAPSSCNLIETIEEKTT